MTRTSYSIRVEVDASDVAAYLEELVAAADVAREVPPHLRARIDAMAASDDGWVDTSFSETADGWLAEVRPDGEALAVLASLRALAPVQAS